MVAEKIDKHKSLAIEFIKVSKAFGNQVVCREITLPVKRGRVLSVLGPSGCGKTITIKMLIGLVQPDKGSILFEGIDLAKLSSDDEFLPIRRRISMVFQGAALFDSMNVYDNIAYPLHIQGGDISVSEMNDRVHAALSMVGLPDASEKMPTELSGGMKKRIGLARAIVTKPEVILYDEPTAGLDPINTRRIIDLILMLEDHFKCTSIVIAHDMEVVEQVSNGVAFFYNGHVRQIGSFLELKNSDDAIVSGFIRGDASLLLTAFGSI